LTLREVLDRASKKIERKFDKQPLVEAGIRDTLRQTYRSLGEYPEAERHALRARELYQKTLGVEDRKTLAAMTNLATAWEALGRVVDARKLHEETLLLKRRILGPEDPDTLWSMFGLATVFGVTDRLDEARELHEKTLLLERRILGPEHRLALATMNNLANVHLVQGRFDEARKLYEEILPLLRRTQGAEHPSTLAAMNNLASALGVQGVLLDEAFKLHEESLQLARRILGPKHPETLKSMGALSMFLANAPDPKFRDPPRALKLAQEAVADLGMDWSSWHALGIAHYRIGDWKNAVLALEKSEAVDPGPHLADNGFFLAMAHWHLGEKDKSREWYDKAVASMEKRQPTDAELLRFRREVEELLKIERKTSPK
jgi:tetratricopeptide (TPR) repeat protein